MYKNIILLISLALLIGCSQKKVEKNLDAEKKVTDQNKTSKKDALPVDFVPKHIRLSHIEVVPH